jgi:two-component system alkaline phosphatase synthesis response regulator PhoP
MPKVLIIEDTPEIQKMYQIKLLEEGFAVKTANNGDEGYETAKEFQPDIVLLDIMMPEFDGLHFLSNLRRIAANDPIKVIVLTNLDDIKLHKSLQEMGISDYYVKAEMTPTEMVDKVKNLLGQK